MSYKGMMDGWNGDEDECEDNCGLCEECEYVIEQKGDSDYEAEKNGL